MTQITAQMVKQLREMTGAGPLDCKKALEEMAGDLDKAANYLREKGIASAKKKLGKGRVMNEGVIEIYQHFNKRLGVIVEVNCETDFVANTDQFKNFARTVAQHIAGSRPQYIRREEIPQDVLDGERTIQVNRAIEEGKKPEMAEKVAEGRMNKFYQETVLMEQLWWKDETKTIAQLLEETVSGVGESIQISRFAVFALGENTSENGDEE